MLVYQRVLISIKNNDNSMPIIAIVIVIVTIATITTIATVLLMSVVDRDVALNLDTAYQRRNPNKLPVRRIYCADDTVLISTNSAATNRLLAEVEGVSKQFGLRLNRNTCCYIIYICMNGNVVKFGDGQKLNRVEKTTYLGHQITQEIDVKHVIHHKIHQTLKTWFRLGTFWKTTVCSSRWKLQYTYTNATKESECISIAGPT